MTLQPRRAAYKGLQGSQCGLWSSSNPPSRGSPELQAALGNCLVDLILPRFCPDSTPIAITRTGDSFFLPDDNLFCRSHQDERRPVVRMGVPAAGAEHCQLCVS